MDLNEAIAGRRSVREYTDKAPGEQAIRGLLDAAVRAPSAVNQQPWTFTVVRDQKLLEQVSREAQSYMLANAPADAADAHADHFRTMVRAPGFHLFYHAPVLILIAAAAPARWIIEDCAMAAENLMLAAHGAGLGTCWIGFAQSYLNTAEGKRLLGLSPVCVPMAPIIVGFPKSPTPSVPRKEPEVRWIG
jgi:nitroreductase